MKFLTCDIPKRVTEEAMKIDCIFSSEQINADELKKKTVSSDYGFYPRIL